MNYNEFLRRSKEMEKFENEAEAKKQKEKKAYIEKEKNG